MFDRNQNTNFVWSCQSHTFTHCWDGMSNGSTFVSTHCWANNVCQFDLSLDTQNFHQQKWPLDDLKIFWKNQNDRKWSVLLKTLFLQKLVWNSTRTFAFQAASGFFETNREVPAFFFQNCRKLLQFKTLTPEQRKLSEDPTPGQWERANLWGRKGGGGGLSGLELTDTLVCL